MARMAKRFTPEEWATVHDLVIRQGTDFGLPERRAESVVIGSFNIRKLGALDKKSEGAWRMLELICERFDLLAIQEIQDDLEGLTHLKDSLGDRYGMVVSDITGSYPGQRPAPERLGFLFRWDIVERTEIASDITFDRGQVVSTLYESRAAFRKAFDAYAEDLADWEVEKAERKAAGKKAPKKPTPHLPAFVTFIRQPSCVSFRIPGAAGSDPLEFLAVNAHLLFGDYKDERYDEFKALVGWLVDRARRAERMYHPNIILLGDCNLDFDNPETDRDKIDADLKALNKAKLESRKNAKLNFPFLTPHPIHGRVLRSNARLNQTYDQIGLVTRDPRLPTPEQNTLAGRDPDGFNYDVFNFVELFAAALHGRAFDQLGKRDRKALIKKFEHDLSDHMPIWIRLPKPS
jgi:endonuclease/exonuclease/phosphatase family metal-dependent hydrolase